MNKLLRFLLFSHLLLSCLWPRQSTISLADDNMVDPVTRSIKIVKKKLSHPPPFSSQLGVYNNCCNHLIHEFFRFACEIPYKKRELCLYLIFTPDRLISRVELSSLSPYSLLFTHNSAENFLSQHFSPLKHTGSQCTTELQLGFSILAKDI